MRRGLQPRDGARGRVAVLALDLINDFSFPDGPAVRRALSTRVRPISELLGRARKAEVPVIYANDNLGAWRSDVPALIDHCTAQGRAGADIVKALSPAPWDFIVLKPRHSAFFATPLEVLLDDQNIRTLIIIGTSAESCVWMTACDAHTRGFELVIPADTLAGASPAALRRTLTSLKQVLSARVPSQARSLRFVRRKLA
jgi:nicotinamidase-related amidase